MNEWNELKNKINELFDVLKRLMSSLYKQADGKISQRIPNQTHRLLIYAVIASFAVGMILGKGLSGMHGVKREGATRPSILRSLFGKTIPVPGKQKDGSFVFSNFEEVSDLKAWRLITAKMELVPSHASEGKQSAKIVMYGGEAMSAVQMDDYFESRNGVLDWSKYQAIRFYLFNPRKETERLIFQVKDRRGNRYKMDLHIPGNKGQTFEISTERLAGKINVRQIEQFNLFRWEPKGDREFYLDDVRLIPKGLTDESQKTEAKIDIKPSKKRPVNMLDYGFATRKPVWLVDYTHDVGQAVRIPFILTNEAPSICPDCPAEGGVPFPMGEIKSAENLRLKNARSELVPFQTKVLSQWPDGSIKWLGLHLRTALGMGEGTGFFLEYGPGIENSGFMSPLKVDQNRHAIMVQTGSMEAEFSKDRFLLFKSIKVDLNEDGKLGEDELLVADAPLVLKFKGEEYRTDLADKDYEIQVEEKGSERVVLKAMGWFQSSSGEKFCQAVVRYYLYRDQSRIKVSHTLVYTGYPENHYYDRYKGLKLPPNEPIDSFGIRIPYVRSFSDMPRVQIGFMRTGLQELVADRNIELSQLAFERAELKRDETMLEVQDLPSGWMDISDQEAGITVAVRDFRENFPKAFSFHPENNTIDIDLWPESAGILDLATTSNALGPEARARGNAFGLAKTHEILFSFHPRSAVESSAANIGASFMEPLLVRTNPYWVHATGALGRLFPVDARYASEEDMLETLFDWAARHQKNFQWYGMLDFGDTLSWWRNEDDEKWYGEFGWHPIGRWGWYNCEGVGTHTGALLQFARTGKWKYFEFGGNMARHLMDVDTVHYNTIANDPRLKNVLDDEVSQVGSMHRHNGDHWGGRNEESSHTNVLGILLYYYLTGDERALDVSLEIGEFFLKEPFTYSQHPDIVPHRAMSNALWGDVLLYDLTGDEKYKKAADKIIEIYLQGQQPDGSFLETYNPMDNTWSGKKHQLYMTGYSLGAFISYYELTQDQDVKEMLVKLVRHLGAKPEALHGLAYAFFLTGEPQYIQMAEKALNDLLHQRQRSSDPLYDGLLYKKPIYHRPSTFLYTVPFVFEAFEAAKMMDSP